MEEKNEMTLTEAVEELDSPILPIGWDESVEDIFAESWSNQEAKTADGQSNDEQLEASDSSEEVDESNANGQEASETDESEVDNVDEPATQEDVDIQPTTKHRFKTTVDHKEVEAEVDESEIPELYQRSQALDRVRSKLDSIAPSVEKTEIIRELLGYKTIDEMLDASEKAYAEGEIEKLVGEGVHEKVAKDMVQRQIKELKDKAVKTKKAAEEKEQQQQKTESNKSTGGRDYSVEVAGLLKDHPELKGKTLPPEIVNECVSSGKPLTLVYEQYLIKQEKAEVEKLRKENQTLMQNAEAAQRAPVTGVSKKSATNEGPDDPFLSGFNRF